MNIVPINPVKNIVIQKTKKKKTAMLTQLTSLSIMVAVVASEVIPPMKLALYPDCGELPAGMHVYLEGVLRT